MVFVKEFKYLNINDAIIVGGKGASLGELVETGLPVPNGFVILSNSFETFLEKNDLNLKIDLILASIDLTKMSAFKIASEKIQKLILNGVTPNDIGLEILKSFNKLGERFVAVRSSAIGEDSISSSWAGQLESYLNITKKNILKNVKNVGVLLLLKEQFSIGLRKDCIVFQSQLLLWFKK